MQKKLLEFIENYSPIKVLVLGDLMLDHYISGDVTRISPEAPVPILQVQKENYQLGGAGSCVANFNALENSVKVAAICGKDKKGKMLAEMLKEKDNNTENLYFLKDYKTIQKVRILSHKQHLLRMDYEKNFCLPDNIADKLLQNLGNFEGIDLVIISDYKKGFCSPYLLQGILKKTNSLDIFTVVDPARGVDFLRYKNASCIKPNRLETENYFGRKMYKKEDYLEAAKKIQENCNIPIVVISLDKEGLLIYKKEQDYQFFESVPQNVFDVTGAGDLVVSILGLVLAKNDNIKIAGKLTNIATSIAIKNLGSYHPTWEEIKQEVAKL